MRRHPYEQHIGNAHGWIALWLDETEAIELAEHYGSSNLAYRELMDAVERAYPKEQDDDWTPYHEYRKRTDSPPYGQGQAG